MIISSTIEERAKEVIGQIRKETLQRGEPFMVYDNNLPAGQYYMEYPEGDICIVSVSAEKNDFIVQQELSVYEVTNLRRKHLLPAVF